MPDNDKSKKLLLDLLYANSEADADAIIQNDAEMKNSANWHPLDGRDTNFNVVNNQSSNGAKAATELMTNMVDAILMKRCREENIDPKGKGPNVPKTMYEAVDKFVMPLNGGKIIKAGIDELRDYSEKNLVIGVSGGKKASDPNPCFTFCDSGEGQHPDDFIDTFLSLKAKNKSEIPFVQGKYNMGSSGVLGFCGNNGYKLILSRRYDKTGSWGWTLLRKKAADSGMNYVEYFAPQGKIKNFDANGPIMPFKTGAGDLYDKLQMESGTVVKLYEYYLGKNHVSFKTSREAFNENLVETILPFRIWDFRQTPQSGKGVERELGIDARSFCGMEYLLLRSHAEGVDEEVEQSDRQINISTVNHPQLGTIRISAVLIKKSRAKGGWYKDSINRVFHHVNGQVQLKKTRGYLSQCGLPALKDRVVILVDSSNLKDSTHQNLWKGDREAIRETLVGNSYTDTIKDIIKSSPELKKLNYEITREEVESATQDNSRKMVEDLIKKDHNFKSLLDGLVPGVPVGPGPIDEPTQRDDLKRNPTYLRLERHQDQSIAFPINRSSRVIKFDTDAEDDFALRADNQGYLTISNNEVADDFTYDYNLTNGKLSLYLKPIKGKMAVGKRYYFKVCLQSDEMPDAACIENDICLTVADKADPPPPPPPPPPPQQQAGLPPYRLLTKDGRSVMGQESLSWEDFEHYECEKTDGGYVHDLGDEKVYYINYDNVFFQNYSRHFKGEKSIVERKYVLGMRILMLGMEFGLGKAKERKEDFLSEEIDSVKRAIAQGAAAVILTLCDQMPNSFDVFKDTLEDSDES